MKTDNPGFPARHTNDASHTESVENKDPVCGVAVSPDSDFRHEQGGQTYLFCSATCMAKFKSSPNGYIGTRKAQPSAANNNDLIYTCPMHAEVRLPSPGACPRCGMALEVVSNVAMEMQITKPFQFGAGACALMLVIYFGAVGLISGMEFALDQFAKYWYFILLLALGFGVQVGLYTYLKNLVGRHGVSGKVVAVSGTTSTAAMVSCCAHYLSNILPILGVTGFLAVVAEYQIELFWLGLAFNAAGVIYILSKVVNASREHQQC